MQVVQCRYLFVYSLVQSIVRVLPILSTKEWTPSPVDSLVGCREAAFGAYCARVGFTIDR